MLPCFNGKAKEKDDKNKTGLFFFGVPPPNFFKSWYRTKCVAWFQRESKTSLFFFGVPPNIFGVGTLPPTNMEVQKGPFQEKSSASRGSVHFHVSWWEGTKCVAWFQRESKGKTTKKLASSFSGSPPTRLELVPSHQLTWKCKKALSKRKVVLLEGSVHFHASWWEGSKYFAWFQRESKVKTMQKTSLFFFGVSPNFLELVPSHQLTWKCKKALSKRKVVLLEGSVHFHVSKCFAWFQRESKVKTKQTTSLFFFGVPPTFLELVPSNQLTWKCKKALSKRKVVLLEGSVHFHVGWWEVKGKTNKKN